MSAPKYLIDKSATARMHVAAVATVLRPMLRSTESATCGMIQLEVLFSTQSARDFAAVRRSLEVGYTVVPTIQADVDRAIDVMEELSKKGRHRSAALPDLLIAAVAERSALTVVHYDQDFDGIAEVTSQPMMWVVPRGSI